MNTQEKTRTRQTISPEETVILELQNLFAVLEFKYCTCLFISSLCLLWATGYLGWATGIGCFFMSQFIAAVIIRIDVTNNAANITQECKNKNTANTKYWLN